MSEATIEQLAEDGTVFEIGGKHYRFQKVDPPPTDIRFDVEIQASEPRPMIVTHTEVPYDD